MLPAAVAGSRRGLLEYRTYTTPKRPEGERAEFHVEQYDDEWYEEWLNRMREGGGNIIVTLGLRPTKADEDSAMMEMPFSGAVQQGTGVFAAGPLIQLADVTATIACQERMRVMGIEDAFPLSVQISTSLVRNTNKGKATAESRVVHAGRTMMVVESTVRDDEGRTLVLMTSTHMISARRAG